MKKFTCVFLMSLILFSSLPSLTCFSADKSQVVRVGYYLLENYQEIDVDGVYSGYYYDYLQEISQYTGWTYEYVVTSYSECLNLLENQEIDLLCGIDETDERLRTFDFSISPAISTQYEFYTAATNDDLCYDDFTGFSNMKVAILSNCRQVEELDKYCLEHDFTIEKVYYNTQASLEQAVLTGEADAFYSTTASSLATFKIITRFPALSLYFTTWKGNPIISALNNAQASITSVSPYFEYNLYQEYMSDQQSYRPDFTQEELEYIASNPTILVSYDPSGAPVEYYDTETDSYAGITADIFALLEESTGLHFEYKKSDSFTDSLTAISNGDIDIISAMTHDYTWALENNVYLTTPFIESSVVMVRNITNGTQSTNVVALPNNFHITNELLKSSNFSEILYYDSLKDCIDAVASGKANCTYLNNYVTNYYLSDITYRNLGATQITAYNENLSIAVSRDADLRLLSILNKGLLCISSETKDTIILQNSINDQQPSIKFLIYAYPELAISVIAIIFITILFMLVIIIIIRTHKAHLIQELSQTDSLTGLLNRGASQQLILKAIETDMKSDSSSVGPLISVDLDNFKQVNDLYGHMEGDLLLKAVAHTLESTVRETDITGRMGGDEFIIYLCNVNNKKTAEDIAAKLCSAVAGLSARKKEWQNISASIGVAFASNGMDWEKLYHEADLALYEAKENGKNQYSVRD